MFLIRAARRSDLSALLALARHLDSYNLPADRKFLKSLLADSSRSFAGRAAGDRARYLFVAEEKSTGTLAGCSLILARHGTPRLPHLAFRLGIEKKTSRTLQKSVRHLTLTLCSDKSGVTEIGGLVVLPRYRGRKEKVGKQLSYARFAYLALHPRRFRPRVLVEYLPKLDPAKGNKLWEWVGARFTRLSYHEADRLSARNKEFILSLFPKEKIYADLLPDAVVRALGEPGAGARASLRLLGRIGFRPLGQIDPFDGGPHFGAKLSDISLVRKTRAARVGAGEPPADAKLALVLLERNGVPRAISTPVRLRGRNALLPRAFREALGAKPGDAVSVTPFPSRKA